MSATSTVKVVPAEALDETVTMRVRDLPFPQVLLNSAREVSNLRRSLLQRGYRPTDGDNPITIRRRGTEPEVLIDGNHRTEALLRAGMLDEVVEVRITAKQNWWD